MKMAAKRKSDLQKDVVQKEAVTKIVRHFKKHDRGQLAMFCGTGKTRTAIKAIRRLKSRVVVVCVPTLGLVSQWLKDFAQHGDKRTVLAVCSKLHNETPEQHGIIGATTDLASVRAFAREDGKLLIVSTYHSYDVIQAAWLRTRLEPIDLLIADEAHNTAGRNSKHMGLCLHDKAATVRKRLFMTATRRLYRGEKQEYNCMDDTEVYGDVVYELTIREAIDRGILADYEVHVINVYKNLSAEDLRNINKKGFESGLLARFVAQNLMAEKRVKVFTFHNRVADATKFSEQVAEHGQWSRVLTGEQRVQDREQVLQEFRDEAGSSLIASVNVLGEGIDAPTVDVVVFADRMTEPGAIQQRMGRGTRMAAGKRKLRIILPICVSPKMSDSEVLQEAEESHHKDALHVIRALASHDPKFYRQVADIDLRRRNEVDTDGSKSIQVEDQMLFFDGVDQLSFDTRLLPKKRWPELGEGLIAIIGSIEKYADKYGRAPSQKSKSDWPFQFSSWSDVSCFIRQCHRVESLSDMTERILSMRRRRTESINAAIFAYVESTGKYPHKSTPDKCPEGFNRWSTVNSWVKSRYGKWLAEYARELTGGAYRARNAKSVDARVSDVEHGIRRFYLRFGRNPVVKDRGLFPPEGFTSWNIAFALMNKQGRSWRGLCEEINGVVTPRGAAATKLNRERKMQSTGTM